MSTFKRLQELVGSGDGDAMLDYLREAERRAEVVDLSATAAAVALEKARQGEDLETLTRLAYYAKRMDIYWNSIRSYCEQWAVALSLTRVDYTVYVAERPGARWHLPLTAVDAIDDVVVFEPPTQTVCGRYFEPTAQTRPLAKVDKKDLCYNCERRLWKEKRIIAKMRSGTIRKPDALGTRLWEPHRCER